MISHPILGVLGTLRSRNGMRRGGLGGTRTFGLELHSFFRPLVLVFVGYGHSCAAPRNKSLDASGGSVFS